MDQYEYKAGQGELYPGVEAGGGGHHYSLVSPPPLYPSPGDPSLQASPSISLQSSSSHQ